MSIKYKPAVKHTIPGETYRAPRPVEVPTLTDSELIALSYAYFDKQFDVRKFEDMAGKGIVISGWDDVTPSYEAARIASIREAMLSLARMGLVEGYYEHGGKSRDRIERTDKDGYTWVASTGWRYKLNGPGALVHTAHRAHVYKCCDGVVHLPCVCREKTFCAEHGGGCHGTHD